MGNCLKNQKEHIPVYDFKEEISPSHFSITSEVERHMYFNHFEDFTNYEDFKKWINYK